MLISCKCLNFIASSGSQQFNSQQQQQQQQLQLQLQLQLQKSSSSNSSNAAAVETAVGSTTVNDGSVSPSSSAVAVGPNATSINGVSNSNNAIASALMHIFLQKYPRNFIFYSQFMEFFKQAIGPIPDLTINAINQRDLIYSVTIDLPNPGRIGGFQTWQLSLCINCNVALCAKKLPPPAASPTAAAPLPQIPQFLVNQMLITTNEELAHRRSDKSFSDTFGVRIIDHPELANGGDSSNALNAGNAGGNNSTTPAPLATFTIGSLSSSSSITQMPVDSKQLRLRQLHTHMQQRLQREIAETNERIQRYTEQQFALLKSFREKSEQEYELLLRLVQRVPEQSVELMDRLPPMLEVSAGAVNYLGARRRNTIGSRRDLNSHAATAPTTPTTPSAQPPTFLALPYSMSSKSNSASESATTPASAMDTNQAAKPAASAASTATRARTSTPTATNSQNSSNTTTLLTSALNRKMSNFDTPPATPEATPMSVGNSPTFKQQQPQPPQASTVATVATQAAPGFGLRLGQSSFQQQFPTPSVETADDCLFEFDGFEDVQSQAMQASYANNLYQQQQQQHLPMQQQSLPYQRHQNLQMQMQHHQLQRMQHQHESNMSDVDESDAAEEAEDALDLDTSLPIPMNRTLRHIVQQDSAQQRMNFGKSLPIEIANSPMASGRSYIDDSEEEVLDNTVDIAASIKALAKSVHGEAVFGDLPRPRLRSEI